MFKHKVRSYVPLARDALLLCIKNKGAILKVLLFILIPQAIIPYFGNEFSFEWLDEYFNFSFIVVFILLTSFVSIAIAFILHRFIENKAAGVEEALQRAKSKFFPIIGLVIIVYGFFATAVPLIAVEILRKIALFLISTKLMQDVALSLIAVFGIAISVYFLVRYGLAMFFLLFEDAGMFSAIAKSERAVRGHFWHVALRQMLIGFLFIVGVVCLGVLSTILVGAVIGEWDAGIVADIWWSMVIQNIFGSFLIPLLVSLNLLIYADLIGLKWHPKERM